MNCPKCRSGLVAIWAIRPNGSTHNHCRTCHHEWETPSRTGLDEVRALYRTFDVETLLRFQQAFSMERLTSKLRYDRPGVQFCEMRLRILNALLKERRADD